jgi:hypothetical protein
MPPKGSGMAPAGLRAGDGEAESPPAVLLVVLLLDALEGAGEDADALRADFAASTASSDRGLHWKQAKPWLTSQAAHSTAQHSAVQRGQSTVRAVNTPHC